MPAITINLVPPETDQEALKRLVLDLQAAVSGIPELRLAKDDLTVLFPADILAWGAGLELIVLVDGLFKREERTPEVLERLWEAIGTLVHDFAKAYVPQCTKVEVIPSNYDQDRDGFWTKTIAAQ